MPVHPLDDFELLMHGVQALRRHVERLACPIQGGSGVRAQFYPHQIQNVQRILSASRIRHLIADEVGMGKTVQSLMVANALRLQKGRLRVRIIVGRAELQSQWIEEILCRAHSTAELGKSVVGDDWFDVLGEAAITSYAETLAADQFDLLILDEPQSLKADLLGYVAEHSWDYSRLLLLTASPNLRDVRRLCELLQMLEPERIERVRRELDLDNYHSDNSWSQSRLRDMDAEMLQRVYERFLESCPQCGNNVLDVSVVPAGVSQAYQQFAEFRRIRLLTDARWKYRNILRSYRSDFPGHLPARRLKHIVVEPTEAERQRMELAMECAKAIDDPENASELLRRVALGGDSLLGRTHERRPNELKIESPLVKIGELSRKEFADSRLDCLVDWLSDFWRRDPKRKVVIAAQDNPTVDELTKELTWRIPEVGPQGQRTALRIVTARDERDLSGSLSDNELPDSSALIAIATSQLREFEAEDALLLIAHDIFRQSYNLQAADALVFYSLPWKPEALDQWIGRVDRLGRNFIDPEKRNSPPKPIRILTIHRNGDPTQQVETVFHRYRVFESALDPDRELLHCISHDIHKESLGQKATAQDGSVDDIDSRMSDEQRNVQQETSPPSGSLWTVERAVQLFNEFLDRPTPEPVLRQTRPLGFVSCEEEQCLASWIGLLNAHRQIAKRDFKGRRLTGGNRRRNFFTLSQEGCDKVTLESLEDRSSSYPAFFISRRNIQRPPRLKVETGTTPNGEPRMVILQFLSHGSPLHDELVRTFMKLGYCSRPLAIILYSLGKRYYPNGTDLASGTYLCGAGFVDSGFPYSQIDVNAELFASAPEVSGARRRLMRDVEVQKFRAGIEADIRFVRIVAPTSLCCFAWGDQWKPCTTRDAADLLSPHWSKDARPNVTPLPATVDFLAQLPPLCSKRIAEDAKAKWQPILEHVRERVEERAELIRIEAEDVLWNLQSAVAETLNRINELEEAHSENNQQTIQLTYRPRLLLLEEQCDLVRQGRDVRCRLLGETLEHLVSPNAKTAYLQASALIRLEGDPEPLPEPDQASESLVDPNNDVLPKQPR